MIGVCHCGHSLETHYRCPASGARHACTIPRAHLEQMVRDQVTTNESLRAELDSAERQRDAYLENLTATQARCTELLVSLRIVRGQVISYTSGALASLCDAIIRARKLHPEGCQLADLLAEAGEVARASLRETPEREREELLDVAVVAMRMWMGEVAR